MNINEQFDHFLADLGVEMERPDEQRYNRDTIPEVSIFQSSREHYGVFYRLDMIDSLPELRVMIPVEKGDTKMDLYLVRLSERTSLNTGFSVLSMYQGSAAYEHGREATCQHLLYAIAEMMKQLFWSGDLARMHFPAEIEVYPLLVSDTRRP